MYVLHKTIDKFTKFQNYDGGISQMFNKSKAFFLIQGA